MWTALETLRCRGVNAAIAAGDAERLRTESPPSVVLAARTQQRFVAGSALPPRAACARVGERLANFNSSSFFTVDDADDPMDMKRDCSEENTARGKAARMME